MTQKIWIREPKVVIVQYIQNLKKLCLCLKKAQSHFIKPSCSHSLVHIASIRVFTFRVEHWSMQRWWDLENRCSTNTMALGITRKSQAMHVMTGNSCWWAYSGLLAILRGDIEIIHLPPKQRILEHIMFLNPVLKESIPLKFRCKFGCGSGEEQRQRVMSNTHQKWVGFCRPIRCRLQWGWFQCSWLIFLKVVLENFLCTVVRIIVNRPEPR